MQLLKKSSSEVKWVCGIIIVVMAFFIIFFIVAPLLGFLISQSREGYAGAMNHHYLYVVETYLAEKGVLPNTKEDIVEFVKNYANSEFRAIYNDLIATETHVHWDYTIIGKNETEMTFLLIVDSSREIWGITFKGATAIGLGNVKKDEKGEWHGRINWFYLGRKYTRTF